jgi:hypothetical protein
VNGEVSHFSGTGATATLYADAARGDRAAQRRNVMATTQSTTTAASGNGYGTPGTANRRPAAALRSHGLRQIRLGIIWFAIGLVITVVTFQHPVGGVFVAAWGPMAFGLLSVVRGIVTLSRSVKLR